MILHLINNLNEISIYYINSNLIGAVFWSNIGYTLFSEIKKFIRFILYYNGYFEIKTPILINNNILRVSQHFNNYHENIIFINLSNYNNFSIKPMNCPNHIILFKKNYTNLISLPIRYSEFSNCFRNESSGSLLNLLRLREFVQDDAHIFCLYTQMFNEIYSFHILVNDIYINYFNFNSCIKLTLRPQNKVGITTLWDFSENKLRSVLISSFSIWSEVLNEAAFYGPKIEYHIVDKNFRLWQCGTIQVDIILPQLFNFHNLYKKKIAILHRAILGSIERFLGLFLESIDNIPFWLSPVQICILNISSCTLKYSNYIYSKIKFKKFRVILDISKNNINYKIRNYSSQFILYLLIIGNYEFYNNLITLRFNKKKSSKSISLKLFFIIIIRNSLIYK